MQIPKSESKKFSILCTFNVVKKVNDLHMTESANVTEQRPVISCKLSHLEKQHFFLRESDTRFLTSSFFHESVSPRPPCIPLEHFWIFSKIRGDIRELMFITRVNYTGDKLFSGVNDTGEKYVPGVVDTVQEKTKKPKIYRWCHWHRWTIFRRCLWHQR